MKITRYQNQSITVNGHLVVTLHDQTMAKCCLYVQNDISGESWLKVLSAGEEMSISPYNTTLTPLSFELDGSGRLSTTFEVRHDPQVQICRTEVRELH